jgi:alpha-1,2-glucosyltransferase
MQHVNKHVPLAYMDEIFHVPQTQAYCDGRYTEWNNKITTLPGLLVERNLCPFVSHMVFGSECRRYLLAALPSTIFGRCTVNALRAINASISIALLVVMLQIDATRRAPRGLVAALGDWLAPTVAFFHFMFYTDTCALLFVMLCFWLAVRCRRVGAGALCGAFAVLARQTNVVWVLFVAGMCVLDDFERSRPSSTSPLAFVQFVSRQFGALVRRYWSFALVALLFVVFVVVNGSIVVGDKENHKASRHFAQLAYAAVFVLAHTALGALRWRHVVALAQPRRLLSLVFVSILLGVLVFYFSEPHPFLLADNRHYTFYLWRRVLDRHGVYWRAIALGPMASVAVHLLYEMLRDGGEMSALKCALLFGASAATLIPSPLLEPRYFTVLLVMTRVHLAPSSAWRSGLETALFAAVTAITLWVFVHKPMIGDDGELNRFMW